ncbi:MAG: hypothetical protein N2749_05480 [Clostridia bacterium]|nr:hypothetical protein [Clostridia bacterium]
MCNFREVAKKDVPEITGQMWLEAYRIIEKAISISCNPDLFPVVDKLLTTAADLFKTIRTLKDCVNEKELQKIACEVRVKMMEAHEIQKDLM